MLGSGSHRATWSKPLGLEVGAERPVDDPQHVAVELGGDAGGVVVGRLEPGDVLHEVGAEQQRVAGAKPGRELGEERRRVRPGARLPIVPPRNATRRAPPSGRAIEVALEVADDGVDGDAVLLGRPPCAALSQRRLADVEGHEAAQRAGLGERVEQEPGLLGGPGAELDEGVGAGRRRRSRPRARRAPTARPASGSTRAVG